MDRISSDPAGSPHIASSLAIAGTPHRPQRDVRKKALRIYAIITPLSLIQLSIIAKTLPIGLLSSRGQRLVSHRASHHCLHGLCVVSDWLATEPVTKTLPTQCLCGQPVLS